MDNFPRYALTLHEPWASAIVVGPKRVENRTWKPPKRIRGELLAIHAGKTYDRDSDVDLHESGMWTYEERPYDTSGAPPHLGCLLGVARVVGVQKVINGSCMQGTDAWREGFRRKMFDEHAEPDTDLTPWFVGGECYGWILDDVRALECKPFRGFYRVEDPDHPSHTIIGDARCCKGANVADSRPATATHIVAQTEDGMPVIIGLELDLDSRRSADPVPVIRASDGTWHRPMTTLELAALQGLPTKIDGEWLELAGESKKRWRQRIGNAVPPPAAEAIARECADVLQAAEDGEYRLRGEPVWVGERQEVAA